MWQYLAAGAVVGLMYRCVQLYRYRRAAALPTPEVSPERLAEEDIIIVGAGISGLCTAKALYALGFRNITILEANDGLGGVWRENYHGAATQGPYWMYEIPDFPWPAELVKDNWFPPAAVVQEYLRRYAEHFHLLPLIRYGHRVAACRYEGNVWRVATHEHGEFSAKHLVMALGCNDSSAPFVPDVPGRENFKGQVLHSSQVLSRDMLRPAANGRGIVVVGGSKSAFDMGQLFPESTTLVMRTPHYFSPHWVLLLPAFDRIFFWFSKWWQHNSPCSWLIRFVNVHVFPFLLTGLNPPAKGTSLTEDTFNGGGLNACVSAAADKASRKWRLEKGQVARFTRDGVVLDNGNEVQADAVVFGTGFEPHAHIAELFPDVHLQDDLSDGLYLDHYLLHPELPSCYFVGFKDPSAATALLSTVQGVWVAHVVAGLVELPDRDTLRERLAKRMAHTRKNFPKSHRRAHFDYFLYDETDLFYADFLMRECGLGDRLVAPPFSSWAIGPLFGNATRLGRKVD